jgi:hypothetical protein
MKLTHVSVLAVAVALGGCTTDSTEILLDAGGTEDAAAPPGGDGSTLDSTVTPPADASPADGAPAKDAGAADGGESKDGGGDAAPGNDAGTDGSAHDAGSDALDAAAADG